MTATTVREAHEGASPAAPGGPVPRHPKGQPRGSTVTLTGRGGIVVLLVVGLLGALLSRWLGIGLLAGLGFALGCALAALATRQADLLTLVVSPPLVFLIATVLAELVTTAGEGSLLRGMAVGVLTSLAATAPWLFLGTLLAVGIAIPRGLPATVRELRSRLRGSRLFEEEQNEDPVRWDESPQRGPDRLPHGDVD